MEFELNDIREKIDNYFLGNLSKEEFGKWAEKAYYDLLKGEFLEIKKVIGYPFLKVISKFHIEEDDISDIYPCSIEEIEFIRDVLNGEKNGAYSIQIGIPWNITDKDLGLDKKKKAQCTNLISILNSYSNKQTFTKQDYKECINILNMTADKPRTIQSIIENYIKSFLKNNIDCEGQCLDLCQGMWLYLPKNKTEADMINKIITYLECYIGERSFGVYILFISGVPQITFSI